MVPTAAQLNVVALVGKSVENPNSTFTSVKQWVVVGRSQRRHKAQNTSNMTSMCHDGAYSSVQCNLSLIDQIRECLDGYVHDGIHAFIIEVPSDNSLADALNSADRTAVEDIYQTAGDRLFDYIYFTMTGPRWEDETNLSMYTQDLVDFLENKVGLNMDHWLSVKNRFLRLPKLDPFLFLRTVGSELLRRPPYTQSNATVPALRSGIPELEDVCKGITSVPMFLDFAPYFKLQSLRDSFKFAKRLRTIFTNQIFANPNNMPFPAFSIMLLKLLRGIENNFGPQEKGIITTLRDTYNIKFWHLDGEHYKFKHIDIETLGSTSFFCAMYADADDIFGAFSGAFEPRKDLPCGIRIYKSKNTYPQIGHGIEVYTPNIVEFGHLTDLAELNQNIIDLKNGKPCCLFIDEANMAAYTKLIEVLVQHDIPVRSLLIRSHSNQVDWTRALSYANHTGYCNQFMLQQIFDCIGDVTLAHLEYIGFQMPCYPPRMFEHLEEWPKMPALKHIQFRYMRVPARGIGFFARAIHAGDLLNLECINFVNCDMEKVEDDLTEVPGSRLLEESLPLLKRLKVLIIDGNRLESTAILMLADALATLNGIECINFSDNLFTAETIKYCLNALKGLKKLRCLCFNSPPYGTFDELKQKWDLCQAICDNFAEKNSFPAMTQLRFVGYDLPEHIRRLIAIGVNYKRHYACAVEF